MDAAATGTVRYHGLDFLRASMMLMGVLLHAGVMYMPLPYGESIEGIIADPLDPYRDIGGYSQTAQRIVVLIHMFRMPAFMLLAGFFASMMVRKRGGPAFLKDRGRRIGVPLILFWLLLWPLDRLGWTFGAAMMQDGEAANTVLGNLFSAVSLDLLPFMGNPAPHTMHLWFLYDLVFFYLVTYAGEWLLVRLAPGLLERVNKGLERLGPVAACSLLLPAVILVTRWILHAKSTTHFEVTFSFRPEVLTMLAYYQFFLCGWIVHRQRGVIDFARRAVPVLLPAALVLTVLNLIYVERVWPLIVEEIVEGVAAPELPHLVSVTAWLQSASVWVISLALVGACERWITRADPRLTFLVGASYWLYLIHRPLCVMGAAALQRWEVPGMAKFVVVNIVVTLLCLVSYQFLVRRTWVGVMLNGRRY